MNYFFLNINYNKISEVDLWINDKKFAPIFYGTSTINQILNDNSHNIPKQAYIDAKLFVDTFNNRINSNALICSIGDEYLYIYKQKGLLIEYYQSGYNDLVKGFELDIIEKVKVSQAPLVLVSIKSNRYISAGTFRKLSGESYKGNVNAINYLVNKSTVNVDSFDKYLQCLSSLEFETLIAKFLEEIGLFVPAYKGGFIKNFDLFCKNIDNRDISINNLIIRPGMSITIQLKIALQRKHIKDIVDLYFCIFSNFENEKVLNWKYLENEINNYPNTSKWLKQTLHWVCI
jgi:hypothetical protein